MKSLERYVFGAFLSSFFLAFVVLSFVLTVSLMVQIVGYVLEGIPAGLVGRFALVSFPETMQWTIPLALLVSSILVFSRLSADSEVAAMRACGVNLLTVMRWPLLFALGCTLLGVFVNNEIVPRGHEVRRDLARRISVGAGLELLEPGRMIDEFPKVKIFFDEKEGSTLKGLVVLDYSDPKVDRTLTAATAAVSSEGRDIVLDLTDVTVDPLEEGNPGMAYMGRARHRVKDALKDAKYRRKEKDLRYAEICERIDARAGTVRQLREEARRIAPEAKASRADARKLLKTARAALSDVRTEFQKRLVVAFASICFVLVGVPLGIRAQRRESTIGMAISLVVALGYYLVVILMTSLSKQYAVHPECLIWLPVALCFALASYLIPKNL